MGARRGTERGYDSLISENHPLFLNKRSHERKKRRRARGYDGNVTKRSNGAFQISNNGPEYPYRTRLVPVLDETAEQ